MAQNYKFGIIGVGPPGGILAAHLVKAGYNVVLVDINKNHMNAIKNYGLKIRYLKKFDVFFPKENILNSVNDLRNKDVDILFIAVKAPHLKRILPQISKVIKPNTILVSLQNGFDTEEIIAEYVGEENSLRMIVNFGGYIIDNGLIRMSFFNPPNYLGVLTIKTEEKAKKIAEIINSSGLETIFTKDIKKEVWIKCILNTISPLCVLTHTTMKEIMDFSETREISRKLLREGVEVAKAYGISLEPDFIDKGIDYLEHLGHHRVSMAQDIYNGKPSEIDFLNGKLVEYGKIKGIETIYNKLFVSLIKVCEFAP
ncbi:MAG: ketopantoate reductase family protein [Candidatus Odinarchaeota archaeon]